MSLIKGWPGRFIFTGSGGAGAAGTPCSFCGGRRSRLLVEMGKQALGCIFLALFCTMALRLDGVSSMSAAGLGYVVTAAVVLSAVVSD